MTANGSPRARLEQLIAKWRDERRQRSRVEWTVYERCADELESSLAVREAVPSLRQPDYRGAFALLYSDIEDAVNLGTIEPAALHKLLDHRLVQFEQLMDLAMSPLPAAPGVPQDKP